MREKMPAAQEAETWLKWAEKGCNNKYGSTPLETRIEIGRAWIELARIEADLEIAKIRAAEGTGQPTNHEIRRQDHE